MSGLGLRGSDVLDKTKRHGRAVQGKSSGVTREILVIPYWAPWYELLLSGQLNISTATGKFGVKTGSMPKKYRGWVAFYTSKARVAVGVIERHKIHPADLALGSIVGVGYLTDSRELTDAEKYQWYLSANKIDDTAVDELCRKHTVGSRHQLSFEERIDVLDGELYAFVGSPLVVAGPMDVGHFYRPNSLKRLKKPVPFSYPSGPVQGTSIVITPALRRALRDVNAAI